MLAAHLKVPLDEQLPEIAERIERRQAELEPDRSWVEDLARADATAGVLAELWRAVAGEDARRMLAAMDQVAALVWPSPLRHALDMVLDSIRGRRVGYALVGAVTALAAGLEPDHDAARVTLAGAGSPEARLAGALAGAGQLDDPPTDEELAAGVDAFAAVARRSSDAPDALWRLYDVVETLPGKSADVWTSALRERLLDLLSSGAGLDAEPTYSYRSHLSFVLGDAFVPDDTSQQWVLFSRYIPDLRERILAETGYRMPGFNVRADRYGGEVNIVHLLLHDAIIETHRLPTDGVVVRYPRPDLDGSPDGATLTDPLTGDPVGHLRWDEPMPPTVVEVWEPLEFVMRHVERFVRQQLANIVTIWDVRQMADEAGPEAVDQLADPAVFVRWLSEARQEIARGGSTDLAAMGRAIAGRIRP
jgi:hypothetical protein